MLQPNNVQQLRYTSDDTEKDEEEVSDDESVPIKKRMAEAETANKRVNPSDYEYTLSESDSGEESRERKLLCKSTSTLKPPPNSKRCSSRSQDEHDLQEKLRARKQQRPSHTSQLQHVRFQTHQFSQAGLQTVGQSRPANRVTQSVPRVVPFLRLYRYIIKHRSEENDPYRVCS